MAARFVYFVPCIIHHEGKVGFTAHMIEASGPINSEQAVWNLIDSLAALHPEVVPEVGALSVVPLGWTLISAQRGSAVKPKDNGKKPIPAA